MNKSSQQLIISIVLAVCGFAAVFFLSGFVEKNRPALPEGYEDEDLALQGAKLKGYALGFEGLLADWYWMKSLQYIGDKVVKSEKIINMDNMQDLNPRLLYPYLDTATTLDPKFFSVYEYGAIVLPAINKEQAIKLTEKGIENNPNEWRLYNYLGYIYWRSDNYQKAAELYERGSQISGAPDFMRLMAAKMTSQGGSRQVSREIYHQMVEQATDVNLKNNAALRLLEVDSFDEKDAIRSVLQSSQAKFGRCVNNWREIFPQLRTQKTVNGVALRFNSATLAPLDPTGFPYILQNETGKCDVEVNFLESNIPTH